MKRSFWAIFSITEKQKFFKELSFNVLFDNIFINFSILDLFW